MEYNSEYQGSHTISNLHNNWSLSNEVLESIPYEDMGVAILQDDVVKDTNRKRSSSHLKDRNGDFNEFSQPNEQIILLQSEHMNQDFFVFKRRHYEVSTREDKINNYLKDENLLHIFSYLPQYMLARCAQVCHRWRRVALDESLWRRLDLGTKTLSPGVVGRVILRGTKYLRLAKTEINCPVFCPKIEYLNQSEIVCKLTHLDLSMADMDVSGVEEIIYVCRTLKKLSLEHGHISKNVCCYIANNPNLDTLNLSMAYNLNGEGISIILRKCQRLHTLNVAWTYLNAIDISVLCANLHKNIKRLNVSGYRDILIDGHIKAIVMSCPALVELDLSDSTKLTAETIRIISSLPDLKALALSRCYSIPPKAYLDLKRSERLKHMDSFGIFSEGDMQFLSKAIPGVEINKNYFSTIARPTVGIRRTAIWGERVKERYT